MDSNHGRRPYESRVAPCVVTVAGPGIEPGSLTRWGMSPVGCHCPSLRRPRADSNGKAALRKRSARSPSESKRIHAPRNRTPGVARRGTAPRVGCLGARGPAAHLEVRAVPVAVASREGVEPSQAGFVDLPPDPPAETRGWSENQPPRHPVSVSIRFLDFEGVAT